MSFNYHGLYFDLQLCIVKAQMHKAVKLIEMLEKLNSGC